MCLYCMDCCFCDTPPHFVHNLGDAAKCHSLAEVGAGEHIGHCAAVVCLVLMMVIMMIVAVTPLTCGHDGHYNA